MIKVNWNTSRTDIPIFDNSLAHPRNPHRDHVMKLRWISPQKFIGYQYDTITAGTYLAPGQSGIEMFWKGVSYTTVADIKEEILNGKQFYAFVLEFEKNGDITYYQEGRHRAVAMMQLGVKRIPVYFAYNRFDSKYKAKPLL